MTAGCTAGGAVAEAPVVVETGVTAPNSIALTVGGDSRAWVAYNDVGVMRVARCNSPVDCATPVITNVGNINGYAAMSTGIDGIVWFGGRATSGRARLGRCTDLTGCADAQAWTLSSNDTTQPSPVSVARGVDGSMVVAATYGTALRVFRCGSTLICTDGGWPR